MLRTGTRMRDAVGEDGVRDGGGDEGGGDDGRRKRRLEALGNHGAQTIR